MADINFPTQFINKYSSNTSGKTPAKSYILKYMLRDGAVMPLIVDNKQHHRYLMEVSNLRSPADLDAVRFIERTTKYDGIGFDLDNIAMNRVEQLNAADRAQDVFDSGGSIRQCVASFDTKYLQDLGIVNKNLKDPVPAGQFFGNVKQYPLRVSIQDGLRALTRSMRLHDPQAVCALQFDTGHVHAHICFWDNQFTNTKGMITPTQIQTFINVTKNSLAHQPMMANENNGLVDLARLTQSHAKFKKTMLSRQLYLASLELSDSSMNLYVHHLMNFDQKNLTGIQQRNFQKTLVDDFQRHGQFVERMQNLSRGQVRARRQLHAEVRAVQLRREMQAFNSAAGRGQVAPSAWNVKDSMNLEYLHQQQIVEKYRMFSRPRTDAVFQAHRNELEVRRAALLETRRNVLHQLPISGLRKTSIEHLMQDPSVMVALGSVHRGVGEMQKAADDPKYPLDEHVIHAVSKTQHDQGQVEHNLRSNQVVETTALTNQQRRLLFNYLQSLEDYEMDAMSLGGVGSDQVNLDFKSGDVLPKPSALTSIYDRQLGRNNSVLLASDLSSVVDQGPVRPGVQVAFDRGIQQRSRRLTRAMGYFNATRQKFPDWVNQGYLDLQRDMRLSGQLRDPRNRYLMPNTPETSEEDHGYAIDNAGIRRDLVNKHLHDVDEIGR